MRLLIRDTCAWCLGAAFYAPDSNVYWFLIAGNIAMLIWCFIPDGDYSND